MLLASEPPLKRIERLIQFDLLPKNCFDSCEDEFIDYIARKSIKNQTDAKLKGKLVFTKPEFNNKYLSLFNHPINAYAKQKQSFGKRGYQKLFEEIFKVSNQAEYESVSNLQKISSNMDWTIEGSSILVTKKVKNEKVKAKPHTESSQIEGERSISSSVAKKESLSQQSIQRSHYMLESCLNMAIDISSILDLVSDLIILIAFVYSGDTAWLFVSLFTMLCPYYAVYTSLMNFQIHRNRARRDQIESKCTQYCLELMNTFFIFPTMLIYLIMYDLIYSIANTMILPFLIIASLIMRDNYIEPFETFLDRIMVYSTGMSYMDIKGFRS